MRELELKSASLLGILRRVRPRRQRAGQILVGRWVELPVAIRAEAVRLGADVLGVGAVQAGALTQARVIADLGAGELAVRLVPLIMGGDRAAADAALEALLALTATRHGVSWDDVGVEPAWECIAGPVSGAAALHRAVATLAGLFPDHRRREVFIAAMAALGPGALAFQGSGREPLAAWFMDAQAASHLAFRAEIKKGRGSLWRARAWQWLGREPVAAAAMERLSKAASMPEHETVLGLGHLALNPRRARRLAMARSGRKRAGSLLPDAGRVGALSDGARLGYVRVVRVLAMDEGERAQRLAGLQQDALGLVRWAAGRASVQDGCERGNVQSGTIAARERLVRDRAGLVAELRAGLNAGAGRAGEVLRVCSALGLEEELELELLGLASRLAGEPERPGSGGHGPAARLLAQVASALGRAQSEAAASALEGLSRHGDARVRCNAMEALWRRGRGAGYLELKDDASHRVRASALRRAVVEGGTGQALDALARMMEDERPLHRLAAVWAAERAAMRAGAGAGALGSMVSRLACGDPEEVVRARARRCAARLLAVLRGGWERRAAAVNAA